jgi:hypothetical protein
MAAIDLLEPAGDQRAFLLQRVQPAMTGLIDGSLSTLAPIFSVALATHRPHYAFFAGLATAIGAGVSMAFSEADFADLLAVSPAVGFIAKPQLSALAVRGRVESDDVRRAHH